jgi:hypothetical protein
VSGRFRNAIGWLLLAWGLLTGVVVWISRKSEKQNAVLVASAYMVILIYGFFFRPKGELRKHKFEYVGIATIFAFWLFLTFALFAK